MIQDDVCGTLLARDYKDPKCVRLGNVYGEEYGTGFGGNVWDGNGVAPTLKTTAAASQQFVTEMVQLPHGFNPGHVKPAEECPSITTSCWECNNFIVEREKVAKCVGGIGEKKKQRRNTVLSAGQNISGRCRFSSSCESSEREL